MKSLIRDNETKFPSFRLEGRVAVVTGGGSGMGRTFSTALAQAGADIVFLACPASAFITGHTLVVDGGWTAI